MTHALFAKADKTEAKASRTPASAAACLRLSAAKTLGAPRLHVDLQSCAMALHPCSTACTSQAPHPGLNTATRPSKAPAATAACCRRSHSMPDSHPLPHLFAMAKQAFPRTVSLALRRQHKASCSSLSTTRVKDRHAPLQRMPSGASSHGTMSLPATSLCRTGSRPQLRKMRSFTFPKGAQEGNSKARLRHPKASCTDTFTALASETVATERISSTWLSRIKSGHRLRLRLGLALEARLTCPTHPAHLRGRPRNSKHRE
mmetsp:Transcript_36215/g.96208  ORF Transcript_36215/g.96208 Transcript_36215/m.96208 type:complete len:259 (-) Transcript_36215:46-822(-)